MSKLRDAAFSAAQMYLSAFDSHELKNLNLRQVMIDELDKGLIEAILKLCSSNQSWAADVVGLSRNTLRKRIQQLGLAVEGHERRRNSSQLEE